MSTRVVFEVRCEQASVERGEQVRLIGSSPTLGGWNIDQSVELTTSERDHPVWRQSVEIPLQPSRGSQVIQYKYIKVLDGSVIATEAGPNRTLDLSCLSESMVNYVDDLSFDVSAAERRSGSGIRIRFQETAKSAGNSAMTSCLASNLPSPLRMSPGHTPAEKSDGCIKELQSILTELTQLKPMNLACQSEIRRAATAIRNAIEVERRRTMASARKKSSRITCAMISLFMVPLLPMMVASAIILRVPSARSRYNRMLAAASDNLQRALPPQPFGFVKPSTNRRISRLSGRGGSTSGSIHDRLRLKQEV
eukprot:TRINITY_DN101628_c0_g1_i1.p1 TRINITY_DN101628_c0_g1~~TRINITY_DN101628_c0_g1_i1.p1  ORF type:complete len:308 (-),score=25.54 TRINITY_DN101628_c0_g1_i1:140-1063(-)